MLTRRHLFLGTGLASLAIAVGACTDLGGVPAGGLHGAAAVLDLPLDGTPHTSDAAVASARIAWQVMAADTEVRSQNLAIAPSSLAVTLAMLAEGASGKSLASLDDAFGLAGDERSAAIGALRQALSGYEELPNSVDADDPPETPVVHQANRVVILDDAVVEQRFLDRLSAYYDTGGNRVPRDGAKADLDAWANQHTAGLIRQSAIEISDLTRLITQDAILFAARWRDEFENDNVPLPFTKGDGTRADIDALGDTLTIPHATGDQWQAVRIPYDDVLAMDIVLPDAGIHPSDLGFETVNASVPALSQATERTVDLTLPASDVESKWDLLQPLEQQGIDLSELEGIMPDAYTAKVAQQVRLTVTAKGTVGAALTEAEIAVSSLSVSDDLLELRVDRPFVIRVLDTRTGWPLFLAIVNDPAAQPA